MSHGALRGLPRGRAGESPLARAQRGLPAAAVALLLSAVGLAAVSCGVNTEAAPETARPAPTEVPGVDLRPQDDIDALDCAGDRRGEVHLVWREVLAEPAGGPRYRVRYARTGPGGRGWLAPVPVAEAAGPAPRLVLLGRVVHLLAGPSLGHFVAGEGGSGWSAAGPLLVEPGPPVLSYSAAAVEGRLLAVSFARRGDGSLTLDATVWDPAGGVASSRRLATFPATPFDPPAPALAVDGGVVSLVVGVNGQERKTVREGGRSSEVITPRARLVELSSRDGGRSWTSPQDLPPAATGPPATVRNVSLAPGPDGLLCLYTAHGVWVQRLTPEPGRPVQVAAPERSALHGGTGASSVTAARDVGGAGALVWIDERFRKSDRRWWKPLGGWPWSDAPDWINNDLFSLPLAALGGAPDASVADLRPERQTVAGSYAVQACLVPQDDDLLLVWTGRSRVGKTRSAFGAAPRIYTRRLRPAS